MKRIIGSIVVALVAMTFMAGTAQAKTIVRDGADANGWANPGGCVIFVHEGSTELHVNCRQSTEPARIRYRYLKSLDVVHSFASFKGVIEKHGGEGEVGAIRWLCEPDGPRTGRVIIPAGLYVHIVEVTWKLRREG